MADIFKSMCELLRLFAEAVLTNTRSFLHMHAHPTLVNALETILLGPMDYLILKKSSSLEENQADEIPSLEAVSDQAQVGSSESFAKTSCRYRRFPGGGRGSEQLAMQEFEEVFDSVERANLQRIESSNQILSRPGQPEKSSSGEYLAGDVSASSEYEKAMSEGVYGSYADFTEKLNKVLIQLDHVKSSIMGEVHNRMDWMEKKRLEALEKAEHERQLRQVAEDGVAALQSKMDKMQFELAEEKAAARNVADKILGVSAAEYQALEALQEEKSRREQAEAAVQLLENWLRESFGHCRNLQESKCFKQQQISALLAERKHWWGGNSGPSEDMELHSPNHSPNLAAKLRKLAESGLNCGIPLQLDFAIVSNSKKVENSQSQKLLSPPKRGDLSPSSSDSATSPLLSPAIPPQTNWSPLAPQNTPLNWQGPQCMAATWRGLVDHVARQQWQVCGSSPYFEVADPETPEYYKKNAKKVNFMEVEENVWPTQGREGQETELNNMVHCSGSSLSLVLLGGDKSPAASIQVEPKIRAQNSSVRSLRPPLANRQIECGGPPTPLFATIVPNVSSSRFSPFSALILAPTLNVPTKESSTKAASPLAPLQINSAVRMRSVKGRSGSKAVGAENIEPSVVRRMRFSLED